MNKSLINITLLFLLLLVGYLYASESNLFKSDIIFDHQLHTDLECTDCHTNALESKISEDKLFPEMEFCGDCHDIEESDNCSTCHRNIDDPEASPNPVRAILFSHKRHYELEISCSACHLLSASNLIPGKQTCMDCHNGQTANNDCALCHGPNYSLFDIHPLNWKLQHGDRAVSDKAFCSSCHKAESFCIDCHRGDNTSGTIHDLNYRYTHALDANGRGANCNTCHDGQTFCNDCHLRENRMPLEHSTLGWIIEHGEAARNNIENCTSCHDSSDPNCSRAGCHSDYDGLRGTNPPIHSESYRGGGESWHGNDGAICYQCHTNTRTAGTGFCGYCHGFED